jgi:hypothetical protein
VGAPPSATSCIFGGQGGVGAPPSAFHWEFTFQFTDEAPALFVTSDNAATHRHAATTTTLLFTFISFSSLNLKKRSVDRPGTLEQTCTHKGACGQVFVGIGFYGNVLGPVTGGSLRNSLF